MHRSLRCSKVRLLDKRATQSNQHPQKKAEQQVALQKLVDMHMTWSSMAKSNSEFSPHFQRFQCFIEVTIIAGLPRNLNVLNNSRRGDSKCTSCLPSASALCWPVPDLFLPPEFEDVCHAPGIQNMPRARDPEAICPVKPALMINNYLYATRSANRFEPLIGCELVAVRDCNARNGGMRFGYLAQR